MANTKSAAKRARQTKTRSLRNRSVLTSLKTTQKSLRQQLTSGDQTTAQASYRSFVSELDRATKRGVIHANAANRYKSSFALLLNGLKEKAVTPAK